jgi:tetratricopeptide (TPR) repeat protein
VVAIFQQMQELNLPYIDPDGLYRSAYSQLVREREQREQVQREQERKNRELENLYNQGVTYFQAQDWYEAQRKFKEILRLEPRYRDTEAWLVRVKEKLELTKWRSIGLIIIGWVISGLVQMDYYREYGVIGGFVSGAVIWWVSQRTKQSEPSQQVLQFLGFCLMGVVAGVILGLTIYNLDSSKQAHGWITAFIGAAISVGVLLWQIRRQVFRV